MTPIIYQLNLIGYFLFNFDTKSILQSLFGVYLKKVIGVVNVVNREVGTRTEVTEQVL